LLVVALILLAGIFILHFIPKKKTYVVVSNSTRNYKIKVYGTEYTVGQHGTVFLQLLDDNYQPIENGSCWLNVYYPNKTYFIYDALMQHKDEGLYYYDFVCPEQTGVYMLTTRCWIPTKNFLYYASSFTPVSATNIYGDYTLTWEIDEQYHQYTGFEVYYDLTGIQNVTNATVNIMIVYKMTWCNDCLEMYVYNFTSGTWVLLPNRGSGRGIYVNNPTLTLSNSIDLGYIDNGVIRVGLRTTTSETIKLDYLVADVVGFATVYEDMISLRGSGEIHVSKPVNATFNITFPEVPEVGILT